jgi:ligand-binding SRPBCC domain-containing protein
MPLIRIETIIQAPIERCFDLARNIDVHMDSMGLTNERAVGGVMHGLVALGDTVTWEGTHLGIRQRLTSKIMAFDPPRMFTDEMQRGAFHHWHHEHWFEAKEGGTVMTDVVDYASPLGVLGRLVDAIYLENYVRQFLARRNEHIKAVAETTKSVPPAVAGGRAVIKAS